MNAQRGRLARQAARRHQRERLAGIVLAVVGVVVLIVAVVALRDPRSDGPQSADKSVAVSESAAAQAPTASATPTSAGPTRTGSSSAPPVNLGSSTASGSASSSVSVAAKSVPLVVLNNTTVSGLAKSAATRFENAGWTVTSSGNFSNDIISTCAYYDPDTSGAKAAAQALQAQFPTIKRVQPKFAELPSGPVVVVLTPDYQSG